MQKRVTFKNRNNKKIVILVEEANNPRGLAFIMHGLGGLKEQPHIEAMAQSFSKIYQRFSNRHL